MQWDGAVSFIQPSNKSVALALADPSKSVGHYQVNQSAIDEAPALAYCNGAVIRPSNLLTLTNSATKYVVFYPQAGMGNVFMGYVSAVIYACLTGRVLKIAPPHMREQKVFQCKKYFDDFPGSICDGLEMSETLAQKYAASHPKK